MVTFDRAGPTAYFMGRVEAVAVVASLRHFVRTIFQQEGSAGYEIAGTAVRAPPPEGQQAEGLEVASADPLGGMPAEQGVWQTPRELHVVRLGDIRPGGKERR